MHGVTVKIYISS